MIDIENMVLDLVATGVATADPSVNVTSAFVEEAATFPCITVRQKNSIPVKRMNTADSAENYTTVTIEITAYSDKQNKSQSECRKLLNLVDGIITGKGFERIYLSEAFNVNRTITRRYARYRGIIRAPYKIGDDTIYEVYRR